MKHCIGGLAAAGMVGAGYSSCSQADEPPDHGLTIYFGDIHNHNGIGYGVGSPERSFDIARSQLDFYCFTPHAYFDYDVTPDMVNDILTGKMNRPYIKITHDNWPRVLELTKQYHKPGTFVTFPGYERHSVDVGDLCIIFPGDDAPLTYFKEVADYLNHGIEHGAIIIPHHPGYSEGLRGASPRHWNPLVMPLLEMFSEHGNAECGTAPKDYIRHSMMGRLSSQTMQAFLDAGHRFGIIASTDDHLGFPGAWGEGKAAVLAPELTRDAVFDALKKRRTYAVSGDKISVDFRVNNHLMGEELPYTGKRTIFARVEGWDWIDRVEVLKNNHVIHRDFPFDRQTSPSFWKDPVLVRLEYGWGPIATIPPAPLDMIPEVYDWEFAVSLTGGRILDLHPCWQSGPYEEDRRHRITQRSDTGFAVTSYTSRREALEQRDTNAVVLKLQGTPESTIKVTLAKPMVSSGVSVKHVIPLSKLLENDYNIKTVSNSLKIHQVVPMANARTSFKITDDSTGGSTDWYYIRVIQKNEQLAWSSPIWVEKKG